MTNRCEETFTHTGFCCWNDTSRALKKHATSGKHEEASLKLKLMMNEAPINAILDKVSKQQQEDNNEMLVLVVRALKYLARQGLAFRGTSVKEVYTVLFITL